MIFRLLPLFVLASWFLGTITVVLACLLLATLQGLTDNELPDFEFH